ncbi:transmembrane protein 177 [Temnothorax nylanderi]|uniref:transmembrane protein 177 n=1 Tax=Temnothorax nylanderi TaxID=102681 RepID=UPI003A889B7D
MNVFSFKYRNVILGVTAIAVGYCAVLTPHTVFLKKYRYMVARYQMSKEVPLGSKIQERIQKVMDDLKLPDDVRNAIKPFSVFGLDMLHAGTLNAKYGAILGIPVNFTNTAEQLRENLRIKEEPVDWTRQDARIFLKAVMLSEDAQKFAIAREILRIQAEEPYFNSLVLVLTVAALWTLCSVVSYRFSLREGNATVRRIFYAVFTLFGVILWLGVKDYRSNQLDKKDDEALCRLGAEYIKGGQEFYEKMLIRNRALRSLLGAEGKKIYTAYGNEETFLRQKHMPITHRKDFFDSHLRNLEGMK